MTEIGILAKSKAGHDKNQFFVVIACDDEYVFLADGENRPVCRPKKKRRKHVQLIKCMHAEATDDASIRKTLKDYERSRAEKTFSRHESDPFKTAKTI